MSLERFLISLAVSSLSVVTVNFRVYEFPSFSCDFQLRCTVVRGQTGLRQGVGRNSSCGLPCCHGACCLGRTVVWSGQVSPTPLLADLCPRPVHCLEWRVEAQAHRAALVLPASVWMFLLRLGALVWLVRVHDSCIWVDWLFTCFSSINSLSKEQLPGISRATPLSVTICSGQSFPPFTSNSGVESERLGQRAVVSAVSNPFSSLSFSTRGLIR